MTIPLTFDGFDEAIIGIASRTGQLDLIAYSYEKMVTTLVDRDGMTREDAIEYLEFNTFSAWVGEATPLIVYEMDRKEIDNRFSEEAKP